jgi:hypothetical protein
MYSCKDMHLCSKCAKISFDEKQAVEVPTPAKATGKRRFWTDTVLAVPIDVVVEDEFPDFLKLRLSSKIGCPMCGFLVEAVQAHIKLHPELIVNAPSSSKISVHLHYFYPAEKGAQEISGSITVGENTQEFGIDVRRGNGSKC